MDNSFYDDTNALAEVEGVPEDLVDVTNQPTPNEIKKGMSSSTSKRLEKILERQIDAVEKRYKEDTETLIQALSLLRNNKIEKPINTKVANNIKDIKVTNIHNNFAKLYLKDFKSTTETFIKDILKRVYFEEGPLNITSKPNTPDILNIPKHDLEIINLAKLANKIGVYPTSKDIQIFVKYLEKKYNTIRHNNKDIDLSNVYSNIIKNPELFSGVMVKNDERYKINEEFYHTLKEYQININMNKPIKIETIEETFKSYLNNNKKLFIKIDTQYEKYINILNNEDENNYLIHDDIIYMNKNKFDEVTKQARKGKTSEFKPEILDAFRSAGISPYTYKDFKSKIEKSYK